MSTEAKQPFGAWLREEMLRQGYEVDGPRAGGRTLLAKRSGISLSIISRILNDDRVPEPPALRALGKALGYNLGEMMIFAGLAEPEELPRPVAHVSGAMLSVPPPDASSIAVPVEDEPGLTMKDALKRVEDEGGPLNPNERALVANLEAMEFPPAEVAGAIQMLRRWAELREELEVKAKKKA